MTLQNRQLNLSQVCVDLHIQPNLRNERSCALGHSLVGGIDATVDPTVYHAPLIAGSTETCRVILHETPYGRAHALTACSCEDWQVHHRDAPMSSSWICPHGASVLLSLGRSDIYLDFVALPKAPSVPTVEMDFGLDRRRFFAAFGKNYIYRWAMLGIDKDMAMEAYRIRFGVDSLSKLKQSDWAITAAEVQSAVRSDMIMINKAAEIKDLLLKACGSAHRKEAA
ncbi:hypothetical protein IH992_03695 [Candidatus Poribacteria bacterium]|nr:hypothetical protein [Candidatus Poribacteria bacterium]